MKKKCPICAEYINWFAKKCPFCNEIIIREESKPKHVTNLLIAAAIFFLVAFFSPLILKIPLKYVISFLVAVIFFIILERPMNIQTSSVLAFFALIISFSIFAINKSELEELMRSKRPYFTIMSPQIVQLNNEGLHKISITFKNLGTRPATSFRGKIAILDAGGRLSFEKGKIIIGKWIPPLLDDFSIANEVPPNLEITWSNSSLKVPKGLSSQFVVIGVSYMDPIANKISAQIFYMKWAKKHDNDFNPNLAPISVNEAKDVFLKIKNDFREFISEENIMISQNGMR